MSPSVDEYNVLVFCKYTQAHQTDQTRHGFPAVDRIDEQGFTARCKLNALHQLFVWQTVARAEIGVVNVNVTFLNQILPAQEPRCSLCPVQHAHVLGIRRPPDTDPVNGNVTAPGPQSDKNAPMRRGTAGRGDNGIDAQVLLPCLIEELIDHIDVPQRAERGVYGCQWNDIGLPAFRTDTLGNDLEGCVSPVLILYYRAVMKARAHEL